MASTSGTKTAEKPQIVCAAPNADWRIPDLSSAMDGLPINATSKHKIVSSKSTPVADSWEDEAAADGGDASTEEDTPPEANSPAVELSRQSTNFDPHPPPPTPSSPSRKGGFSYSDLESNERFAHLSKTTSMSSPSPSAFPVPSSRPHRATVGEADNGGGGGAERRPDKTTSTASRLIAAGLGMRPPRRSDAEKEYDKVARDTAKKQQEKQREEARRQQEEAERAKAAVWDD